MTVRWGGAEETPSRPSEPSAEPRLRALRPAANHHQIALIEGEVLMNLFRSSLSIRMTMRCSGLLPGDVDRAATPDQAHPALQHPGLAVQEDLDGIVHAADAESILVHIVIGGEHEVREHVREGGLVKSLQR